MQGAIERASAYDPRDLFSGAPPRMAAALRALLGDPQNNLRLFWRGAPVPPAPGGLAAAAGALPAVQALGGTEALVDALVAVLHAERAPPFFLLFSRSRACRWDVSLDGLVGALVAVRNAERAPPMHSFAGVSV